MKYHEHINPEKTPQREPIPGREKEMVKNLAGGYAFPVTDWVRLDRFLILGSEGGTYYIGERELTIQNAQAIQRCLKEDANRVVDRIVEISESGRAAKNDPAIFALALASSPKFNDNADSRKYALSHLSSVARIGTHLFQFVDAVNTLRGWGPGLRRAINRWYNEKPADRLAYQMAKYQQRGGWSHHDVMHLSHPIPSTPAHQELFSWAKDGELEGAGSRDLRIIRAMQLANEASTAAQIVSLIDEHRLTREMIPTKWLNEVEVWDALLEHMPMFAMIRNLGKMTQVGLLKPLSDRAARVVGRLNSPDAVTRSRLHPWNILNAQYWYSQGKGMFGKLTWRPVDTIVDALDKAFMLSFGNVEPTNKRIMICIDVSGSMSAATITVGLDRRGHGVRGMWAGQAAAAMAMVTARTEPNYHISLFNTQARSANIRATSSLADVARTLRSEIRGGTSYAAPIVDAQRRNLEVDAFVLFGDEQSWYGGQHAAQAVVAYRKASGIPAKLVVANFCATQTTVADPLDAGMLNVVGLDTNAPRLISDFIRED